MKKLKSKASSYASLKKKIQKWIEEAQKNLLLQAWTIEIDWELNTKAKSGAISLMSTTCLPHYLSAHLTVHLGSCFQCSDEVVRSTCYHELFHAVLSEFVELASSRSVSKEQLANAEEKLVQTLAKIAVGL